MSAVTGILADGDSKIPFSSQFSDSKMIAGECFEAGGSGAMLSEETPSSDLDKKTDVVRHLHVIFCFVDV